MSECRAALTIALVLITASVQAQVDVWIPSSAANTGGAVNQPFGLSNSAASVGSTISEQLSAAALTSAGLTAGAVLQTIALAPNGSGTLTITNFRATCGLSLSPWSTTTFLGNFVNPTPIWDSTSQGTFLWNVSANTWNNLNTTPIGLTWDGVSDIGLYLTASGVTIAQAPGGGPIAAIWLGSFYAGGGTIQRNVANGFAASAPTSTDPNGLRARLTFTPAPPQQPGTVTFLPSNVVTPGNGLTVVFSAPSNGNDAYIPFVSCTPGLTQVPGSIYTIPLNFDVCSSFYYNHALSSIIFPLTPPGQNFGTLTSTGFATGIVFIPSPLVPSGLNVTISIAFVTTNFTTITGAHGPGSFTIL